MRVLLANPPSGFSYGALGIIRPPLGLAYIAEILKPHHQVEIVDFNVDKRHWSAFPYGEFDIVGISVDTSRYNSAIDIARSARAQGVKVAMGGPHVSFMDEETLESGVVDYVVRNEGEYSFLSLVDFLSGRIPFEEVRGVSYLDGDRPARTPDAPFIADLDSLPFPARDLLPLHLYKEKMNGRLMTTVVTSRGCPFKCDFCASSRFHGVRWRARSAENILEEVRLLYEDYGYRALAFVDDNFTLDPRRATQIAETITARGWDLVWSAMTRVDTIVNNPDMLKAMARAGFRWSFIGFESGTQEALDAYGKKSLIEDAVGAMEILKQNKVEVTGAFILGAPDETKEMMKETINFAKRLDPRRAQFSILTPYPGSNLYDRAKHRLITRDWSLFSGLHPTMELNRVSIEEMRKIFISAYASFYLRPGKALENAAYMARMAPTIASHLIVDLARKPIRFAPRPIGYAKRYLTQMLRLIS
jgi:anaerobic magnesium-protoporphyrin IX monomethyl ester cyclase